MKYRTDRNGTEISQLGFGCMRFTRKGGGIDYTKAESEILLAIENGVNYFDTAYIYPGSEELLGRVLDENKCRDKVYIATKLPQYMLKSMKAVEKTFVEELSRLRTDHIDYYLMHMFTDYSEWEKLKKLGIEQWIADRKAEGSIRSIGFSYHGDTDMFIKILNAYDWDFCQIQYNYLDETSQAGRRGLEAAAAKGLPVIIMEPLRGGKLVNLPTEAKELLAKSSYTPAELGLRWLWDQPEVTCVLSGMNSKEMVRENIRIASDMEPGRFTGEDKELVSKVKSIIKKREKVGCTGCRYCMPCPQGVDIPTVFHYYNLMYTEGHKNSVRFEFARNVAMQKEPGIASKCIGCGKCEQHCPQHISIRDMLKKADRKLRPAPYRIGIAAARKLTGR
ncbi:MAG: aldo/keto reductase [Mogibacterium sp.]|nr:aldo/keto reductase [Mogibacterium sp.]